MREIDKILNKDEKIIWEGKPKFLPYILGGSIISIAFGILWMIFLIPFIIMAVLEILSGDLTGITFLFLPHFWIGLFFLIGAPLYAFLVYDKIYYAITDKRIIFQKGLIGRDFEVVDFDKITNAEVNVDFFDVLFGGNSGSILISTAGSFTYVRNAAVQKPYVLSHIKNPYKVFGLLKKVSFNIKTDIEFPNKYRPKTNPGYRTVYKRK